MNNISDNHITLSGRIHLGISGWFFALTPAFSMLATYYILARATGGEAIDPLILHDSIPAVLGWSHLLMTVIAVIIDAIALRHAGYGTPHHIYGVILTPWYLFDRAKGLEQNQLLLSVWISLVLLTWVVPLALL